MTTFLFNRSGNWIAFRRTEDDKYLFNKHGNWIGWFPWNNEVAVTRDGKYLGTVVQNRLLKKSYQPYLGYPGYPGYPGYAGYPGYPGYAGYFGYVAGFEDVPEPLLEN